jgi:hypothetical protein
MCAATAVSANGGIRGWLDAGGSAGKSHRLLAMPRPGEHKTANASWALAARLVGLGPPSAVQPQTNGARRRRRSL